MTINDLITEGSHSIGRIESKQILEYILGILPNEIINRYNEKIDQNTIEQFNKLVSKMQNGYPLQYITNKAEFYGNSFYVDENVLIPQPDTEILVEEVIKLIQSETKISDEIRILDLCTGSGAIAISIADKLSNVKITASDVSEKALRVAMKNYKTIDPQSSIEFVCSNMFSNINDKFDFIVSNPPYIQSSIIKTLCREVQNEPYIALDGGEDGLEFYKIIRKEAEKYLKNHGYILMEIGYDQGISVTQMFKNSICIKDFEERDRVVVWKKQ